MFWLLACTPSPAPSTPVSLEPGVPWSRSTVDVDAAGLQALADDAFRRGGDDVDRKGPRTNALLVMVDGQVVLERYARGTQPDTRLLLWSVTKSVGAMVVGAAVQDGLIHPNDLACTHYEPMCTGGKESVRISDLLRMSSGLDWNETYESSPVFSSVTGMLYTRGSDDMAAFTAAQTLEHPPGTHWRYSSGDSNVVSAALKAPLGERYADYPWTALFEPLGIRATYESDAAGTHVASSYLYTSARDLGTVGQLMLQDGIWKGERLLAPGWVRYSTTLAPAFHTTEPTFAHVKSNPGAQWYVNLGDPSRGLERPWPALPADAFGASGHWGKSLWVIPSWNMVVVRLADDREHGCSYPDEPKCVQSDAFSKARFLGKLAEVVR